MRGIVLSRQAERDLRRIGPGAELSRIGEALGALAEGRPNVDIRALTGASPWQRLRVGDLRIILRPVEPAERGAANAAWLVARVVHRRDLERAVASLG